MFGQMQVSRMLQMPLLQARGIHLPSRVARPMDGHTRAGANSSRKASSLRTAPRREGGIHTAGLLPSVMSHLIVDSLEPPHPLSPLPQGGEGRFNFNAIPSPPWRRGEIQF
jgi:hypothetical protein